MMKKIFILFLIVLVAGMLIFFLKKSKWDGKGDFKIAVVGGDKIGIVSISPERKMVNTLEVEGEVLVWIPGGLGWYRSDRIKRVVGQERMEKNIDPIFFYNLGFLPDKVIYVEKFEDWKRGRGIINLNNQLIYKKEIIKNNLSEDNWLLDEVMARDFADSRLTNDELRLSIINATNEGKLANFIAKRLEWFGFSVVSVDNSETKVEGCLILFGPKSEESLGFEKLNFFGCEKRADSDLNENEVELYFGDKYTQMLKYSTYVGTF